MHVDSPYARPYSASRFNLDSIRDTRASALSRIRPLSAKALASLETDPLSPFAKVLLSGSWTPPPSTPTSTPKASDDLSILPGKRSRKSAEEFDRATLAAMKAGVAKPVPEVALPKKRARAATLGEITGIDELKAVTFERALFFDPTSSDVFLRFWRRNYEAIEKSHNKRLSSDPVLKRLAPKVASYLKILESGMRPAVEELLSVKSSKGKGYGLFANDPSRRSKIVIPKGTILGEYGGSLCFVPVGSKIDSKLAKNVYLFGLGATDPLLADWVIDASDRGNFFRFVNHADRETKECNAEPFLWITPQGPRLIFYALRDIGEEEVNFNYGDEYWENLGEAPS